MADIKGFMKYERSLPRNRDVESRLNDWKEIPFENGDVSVEKQATRCMDCGVPFCHSGCPLGNIIPQFNEAVYREDWHSAYLILESTNNFPEFTGRICPAPCEGSCVLGINRDPVTIEWIEKSIIERAYSEGWIKADQPVRTGKKVAIVGSGPAGLAAADQLNKAGHLVNVFERNDRAGGLLRYGIPDFKLEKWVLDRRLHIMQKSGIEFQCNAHVGKDVKVDTLIVEYDAILLAGGSTVARDLQIPGRNSQGIYFAMEYLEQNNRRIAGDEINDCIEVMGKHVVVIGGGDTGSDCIGTSNRLGAASVTQIEIMPMPPNQRSADNPWPQWPMILRSSSSHEEGCIREWNIMTTAFHQNDDKKLSGLEVAKVIWEYDKKLKKSGFREVEGSREVLPCDLVFLAMGFLHPEHSQMLNDLGVELDVRGNIDTINFQTSNPKIFAAGDMRRGQSLVVWAISEGREAAFQIHKMLLPEKETDNGWEIKSKELNVFET